VSVIEAAVTRCMADDLSAPAMLTAVLHVGRVSLLDCAGCLRLGASIVRALSNYPGRLSQLCVVDLSPAAHRFLAAMLHCVNGDTARKIRVCGRGDALPVADALLAHTDAKVSTPAVPRATERARALLHSARRSVSDSASSSPRTSRSCGMSFAALTSHRLAVCGAKGLRSHSLLFGHGRPPALHALSRPVAGPPRRGRFSLHSRPV